MLKKYGEDSRHAAGKCDLITSRGLKKAPRLELRHDDRLGTGVKRRLDGAAHSVLVKQRHHDQPDFGSFHRPVPLRLPYAPQHAFVAEPNSLGSTSRTSGKRLKCNSIGAYGGSILAGR